jgi:hypothetical protein
MSTNTKSTKKPFCKVCHDAGKPESEYTSHYVRSLPDRNGNTMVTCPTLLCTECRYCGNYGHTAKFCPILTANKNRNKNQNKNQFQNQFQREMPKTTAAAKSTNASSFAVLADSDSEDEEYPALGVAKVEAKSVMTGWTEMAAKPEVLLIKETNRVENHLVLTATAKFGKVVPLHTEEKVRISWADAVDSDDEDEYDY